MSGEWKRPAPLWVRATPLALVVVGIVTLFVYGERERAKKQFDEELVVADNGEGVPQVVYVETRHVTPAHWEQIASLKSLRGVSLSKAVTIGEGIERLTSLPDLQSLTMSGGTYVDDALIQRLAGATPLRRLIVNDCQGVTDGSVETLINWTSLEGVDMRGTSVTLSGLIRLRAARRDLLIVAGFNGIAMSNHHDGSGALTSRVPLRTPADVETFKALVEVPHNWRTGRWEDRPKRQFENVELSGDAAGTALPELAAVLDNVTSLTVENTRITGDIGRWSDSLTSLVVHGLREGSDLSGFAQCRSLTSVELVVHGYGLAEEEAEAVRNLRLGWLGELPDLRELTIHGINLAPEDLEAISSVTALETLRFYKCTCKSIDPLLVAGRLPDLKSLSLYDVEIDAETLAQLKATHPAASIQGVSRGYHFNITPDSMNE